VDEVLAVGDIGFQTKSVQKMRELVKAGTTVVFVSHSLYYISHFCDRAMFLDHGQVKECGPPPEVIGAYQEMMQSRTASECIAAADPPDGTLPSGAPARILEVQLQDRDGITRDRFDMGESLVLRVRVQAPERVKSPVVEFVIMSAAGTLCYKSHNHADGVPMPDVCGEVEVLIEFPELRLLPNTYVISVRLLESGAIGVYDRKESVRNFTISHRGACVAAESGLFYLPHRWRVGA